MTAPELPSVILALSAVAAEVGPIAKDDVNSEQGFKYRSIERILAAAAPALQAQRVVVVPRVVSTERHQKPRGAHGNLWDHVVLTVDYEFFGPAGDSVTATVVAEGLDNGDKGASKAMTMAYKVALLQVLGIAPDVDPDGGNPADEGPTPPRAARQASPSKRAPAKKAPAKKAAARKAAPKPPPLTPDQRIKALGETHGPEHALRASNLRDRLNALPAVIRAARREQFVSAFGHPLDLAPSAIEEAEAACAVFEAEGGPEVKPEDGAP